MIASETEISAFLTQISMPEEKDLRKEWVEEIRLEVIKKYKAFASNFVYLKR